MKTEIQRRLGLQFSVLSRSEILETERAPTLERVSTLERSSRG